MEVGEYKIKPDVILRVPSFILSKIEGSVRTVDMCKSVDVSYAYTERVKNILLEQTIIKLSDKKIYELTDKGKEIQEHLRFIIGKLSEVRK